MNTKELRARPRWNHAGRNSNSRCEHPGCPKDAIDYVDSRAKVAAYCEEHKTWAYRMLAKLNGWDGRLKGE